MRAPQGNKTLAAIEEIEPQQYPGPVARRQAFDWTGH
jgi:hypothetical protein